MSHALVIVESPAKARTIEKYLGAGFRVEASVGHVRDLPENAAQIPEKYKKEPWSRTGVNVAEGFAPLYVVPPKAKEQVRLLKEALSGATALYLATDEDREGESIAWHLREVLQPKVPVKRMVFNEITKAAIQKAVSAPRALDESLVRAQEARRVVDRLYGYDVSPLLWTKVGPKLSAGRVQSVAVRLVVERERQRMAFVSASWWDLGARLSSTKGPMDAALVAHGGQKIASGRDFGEDGKLLPERKVRVLGEADARAIEALLRGATGEVVEVEEKPYRDRPAAPFTTSTLQQESNRKLRWAAKRTMGVAQRLYETGWITYMRTDSTTLSAEALTAARSLIERQYGKEYLPAAPRTYANRTKNAQEAHEAVRPAGSTFRTLEEAERELEPDHFRLYELIWKRTVASQMEDARGKQVRIVVSVGQSRLQANGRTIEFPGFRRAYVEGSDQPEQELADAEKILPALTVGAKVKVEEATAEGHQTRPPARLTEASLVKELEARGIGRPSTYASIIDTILRRTYVFKKGGALAPSFTAFAVVGLLEAQLPDLVDYEFTAKMEQDLDEIALGHEEYVRYLTRFYEGNSGLQAKVEQARNDPRESRALSFGLADAAGPIEVRVGRFGPYLEQGELRADLPGDLAPDELSLEKALELLAGRREGPKNLGSDPESGDPVFLMVGRFGPYIQLGEAKEITTPRGAKKKIKPATAGLLRGMKPEEIDLDTALKLLSLPRNLGPHPDGGEDVICANGPYGPYIKCEGKGSRSLPPEADIFEFSLGEALELLSKPAVRPGVQELGNDPETGKTITLRMGRFGPYVTDGTVNASLPRAVDPTELGLEGALAMLQKKREAEASGEAPTRSKGKPGKKAASDTAAEASQAPAEAKAPAKKIRKPAGESAAPPAEAPAVKGGKATKTQEAPTPDKPAKVAASKPKASTSAKPTAAKSPTPATKTPVNTEDSSKAKASKAAPASKAATTKSKSTKAPAAKANKK